MRKLLLFILSLCLSRFLSGGRVRVGLLLLLPLLLFCILRLNAQTQLCPNNSFEQYDTCPDSYGQINRALFWFNPTTASPDYYHSCFFPLPLSGALGYQNPKTGNAFSGLYAFYEGESYREYIEVQLTTPLQTGITYYVSFYVSLADSMNYATDDIGAYFSINSISTNNYYELPYTPQITNPSGFITDKINWTFISGTFVASGGEQFITIGNFKNNVNTDSIFIGDGGVTQGPDNYGAYYFIDDVCVSSELNYCDSGQGVRNPDLENTIIIYPNPIRDKIFIKTNSYQKATIRIYNLMGELVKEFKSISPQNLYTVDLSEYAIGMYFIKVQTGKQETHKKILLVK